MILFDEIFYQKGEGNLSMNKNTWYTIAGGAWIGGTMTVPGVSGGSMAMILGLYDRLIASVNGIFKEKERRRESFLFLLKFLLGAAAGLFLFAKLITFLLENEWCAEPTRYFFLGAVAGGAPLIFHLAGVKRVNVSVFLYPVIGIAAALLIAMIPSGLFELHGEGFVSVLLGILIQLVGGLVVAVALVLPGISVSQMLLVLGVYEPLTEAVSALDLIALLSFAPLVIGTIAGIFLTTGILEKAMSRHPMGTYLLIFGFILGSLPELFPGVPTGWNIPLCILTAVAGFFAVYFISKREASVSA